MLIGYVSDEMFFAVPDVQLEFMGSGESDSSYELRSRASGAVIGDIPAGAYEVILQRQGYGPKRIKMEIRPDQPYHFRLLSDRHVLGYAWPAWLRSGERSKVCVHCRESYSLELWRYGLRKELVTKCGYFENHPPGANRQLLPDGDFTQTGVAWNEFGYAFPAHPRQTAVAPDRSGLYYFHVRTESGRFFSFPWIVAPTRPTARVAVLASNITWNAYNDFGGRSNYIAAVQLPATPTVNPHQEEVFFRSTGADYWHTKDYEPLSFERPAWINHIDEGENITDPIWRRGAEHVAPAEWRLLGWLEREGFDYDLYAESQLDAGTCPLDQYEVLILSAHPEYWTRRMYFTVKSWVFERGGKLLYLGGNGINCEVELLGEGAMRVWNEDVSEARARRSFQGEGARFPSRFGLRVEEESHLLGVVTSLTGMGTGAPYRVLDGKHWIFGRTGLANGDLFGLKSLNMRCPGGASGHETDKISIHSPAHVQLVAKGINPDEGGAEMIFFDTPSGGAIFSAGSISYASAAIVDEQVSRITANVLNRFLGSRQQSPPSSERCGGPSIPDKGVRS
ncbi:MAG: N,N-dimethylformamidase beta subunit family domain-containing protein [Acidobacteriota bacterium]